MSTVLSPVTQSVLTAAPPGVFLVIHFRNFLVTTFSGQRPVDYLSDTLKSSPFVVTTPMSDPFTPDPL